VTFDPFGDFESRGYLRNVEQEKDLDIVRRLEHVSFKDFMRQKPGEIMGYLAFGHPFLDGNRRTIMVVHSILAQRAGISIDWGSINKKEYLNALTQEIDNPGKGILDKYLKPFVNAAITEDQLAGHVKELPGLSGAAGEQAEGDIVLGKVSEPAVQERYNAQRIQREKFASGA
jgi:cell filamentation protein